LNSQIPTGAALPPHEERWLFKFPTSQREHRIG
jgi:hypothetical protein